MKHTDHFHGSDLEKIEQRYQIKKENITSFSANVNPLGISPLLKETLSNHIDVITTYPDRDYTQLRKSIGEYVQAPIEHILVGNGSTELISQFIQTYGPKKAIIIGPTYSEYEREVTLGGGHCVYYPLQEENNFCLNVNDLIKSLTKDMDLLIICNPNNPTSSHITQMQIQALLNSCKEKDIFVLIDETYIEFAEKSHEITGVPLTQIYDNLMILRGISKFFASPGLRLGYGICKNTTLLEKINNKKNPWTINSLAAIGGTIMFQDTSYIKDTKEFIASERNRIYQVLSTWTNIKAYPPTANFILLRIIDNSITSTDVFKKAIEEGLMIRDCSTFPFLNDQYFRFCFMSREKNDLLLNTLSQIFMA